MEIPTEPMTQEAIQQRLTELHANFQPGPHIKTVEEARALPLGRILMIPTLKDDGSVEDTGLLLSVVRDYEPDDIIAFEDDDGTLMNVVHTVVGPRKIYA